MRVHRSIAHRIQLRRDTAQEMHVHLVQTRSLEAGVYRVGEFIVNARYLDFPKLFVRQIKCLLCVVDCEGLERRGLVAKEGLEEVRIEDSVELAIEHGQCRDLMLGVGITGAV